MKKILLLTLLFIPLNLSAVDNMMINSEIKEMAFQKIPENKAVIDFFYQANTAK